jgi:hypothetical protein
MALFSVISDFRKGGRVTPSHEPPHPPPPVAPALTVWHRVAIKFDTHRMTQTDLRRLAEELYAGGAISLPDARLLSLDSNAHAPNWPDWVHFETSCAQDGRRDWICEVEARLDRGDGDPAYIGYLERVLSVLKRIETVRKEEIRRTAAGPHEISNPAAEHRYAAGDPARRAARPSAESYSIFPESYPIFSPGSSSSASSISGSLAKPFSTRMELPELNPAVRKRRYADARFFGSARNALRATFRYLRRKYA